MLSHVFNMLADPVPACSNGLSMIGLLTFLAAVWHCVYHPMMLLNRNKVKKASFWKGARAQQIALMVNFGFPSENEQDPAFPSGLDDDTLAGAFIWTCFVTVHHCVAGVVMVPVVVYGWEGAGETWQKMFVLGSLAAASWDLYDFVNSTCRTFLPNVILEGAHPVKYWVILPVMHHLVTITTVIPLNLFMLQEPDYHKVACSLLLAAGICYGLGQYKYTLDLKTASGLQQVKAIAVIQFVVIAITRAGIFFYSGVNLLWIVHANFVWPLYGAYFGLVSMGLFNLIVLADATAQLHKWVFASGAATATGDKKKVR